MSEVTRKRDFHHLQKYCTAFILRCSDWSKTWRNMHTTKLIQRSLKQISNGELSDPLCDNVNRDLTLVILITNSFKKHIASTVTHGWVFQLHVCTYIFHTLMVNMTWNRGSVKEDVVITGLWMRPQQALSRRKMWIRWNSWILSSCKLINDWTVFMHVLNKTMLMDLKKNINRNLGKNYQN